MISKQNQKGGDNSTNVQAEQLVINMGIDEKRAREIYQEMNLQLKKEYSREALEIANSRVTEFENSLMSKMDAVDGAMQAFADPSFQLLLVEAQKRAAATERVADYELLSELLVHRFQKGKDRTIRAGISRAVDIVDEISDEALLGMTIAHSVSAFMPVSGDIDIGLDVLNDLFGKILYMPLPTGSEWLDHLEVLNAVRLNSLGGMKKIHQYYPEALSGYVDVGIKKDSENHTKAIEILALNNLPLNFLIEHSLNKEFVRLAVTGRGRLSEIQLQRRFMNNGQIFDIPIALTSQQVQAIESIYDLYEENTNIKQQNINNFMSEWDKRSNLHAVKVWWDSIDTLFQLTSVGKVLAHSNAQRCDKKLPPLA
ncbi:LPO_1073/Vpar_1526 family protein [Vibrio vulnificus]|uniref:LPO_1073/Vpar_1526 family protein n=1 Tax=Vibrio vulnificus TaxID=672 RepID=UPI0005F255F0|nr:LPO_1073/Vpar_1526 family protein [Vibrio vulnificus]ELP1878911.1 hypothetical protein [Vibrio vulnificus]MCA3912792.1 hypothetical protein [Vibrio vulnificus]MCU8492468.1 hypothetical protein [Vibrio vulnificus]RZQ82703.1 hypothetical protein D8T27_23135 [Vibrio vulnificus]